MSGCATVRCLKEFAGGNSRNANVASYALSIVEDADESDLHDAVVACLHDLVTTIYSENALPLLDHLAQGIPDCKICETLLHRIHIVQRT